MSYPETLVVFWLLVGGIILVPGVDMLLTLTHSLARGPKAGFAVIAGCLVGATVHTIWGTLGAALLLSLPQPLIVALLIAGGLYLAWIGYSLLRSSITVDKVASAAPVPRRVAFRQGLLTNLMNPKAYIFVLSVYPQVIRPEFGPLWRQGLVLGGMTLLTIVAIYGAVALAAGGIGRALVAHPTASRWTSRGIGGVFLLLAAVMLREALQS